MSQEKGQAFAREHGMLFIETSALHSSNVQEAFLECAECITKKIEKGVIDVGDENSGVKAGLDNLTRLKQGKKKEKSGCC